MTDLEQLGVLPPLTSDTVLSVRELIVRTLREAILKGRLRPGKRLVQDDLATQLRVSRQPVREALHQLTSEGLILRLPQRGFAVKEYGEDEVRENYYLRGLMESEAARLAAERIRPGELEELRAANRGIAAALSAQDVSQVVESNLRFHQLIHRSTRMPGFIRLIAQLWVGHTVFTPLFIPGRAKRSVEEHQQVLSALEARKPHRAALAMREHIERGAREYFRLDVNRGHSRAAGGRR